MKSTVLALLFATSAFAMDPLVAARPFRVVAPKVISQPLPLVLLLHGFGSEAAAQDAYFKFSELVEPRGFVLALPDGRKSSAGRRFWNATDVCCAFGAGGDDVGYLVAVIEDVRARFSIDAKRIFVVGHSNGGFMAHRLACEHSELIAGIVSVAGATWSSPSKCQPTSPVSVLQVHGTKDGTIKYSGGARHGGIHPGAELSVSSWAVKNGCTGARFQSAGADLDLVSDLAKAETERELLDGCPGGIGVELWRIREGSHIPKFNAAWAGAVLDWLLAHPRR
jgi:polyhydroxybutyrate depolymerase